MNIAELKDKGLKSYRVQYQAGEAKCHKSFMGEMAHDEIIRRKEIRLEGLTQSQWIIIGEF